MKNKGIDARARFFTMLSGSVLALLLETELALMAAFLTAVLWVFVCGKWKSALFALVLYGLVYAWSLLLRNSPAGAGGFTIVTIILRRLMIIGMFVIPFSFVSSGELLASMQKMKIPRFVVISASVLFRFMPTLRDEFQAIRISQKIRGIGRTAWNVVFHPYVFYETLIVPLLIRATRISDELSASAMLRGADRGTHGTSYRQIRFGLRDVFAIAGHTGLVALIVLVNEGILLAKVSI